ncbi:hypothetical protein [Ancylobacter terrae]|uniref:hypothetical protein n=1 Tax=Ancylobacter sp. sgz301288 TaxID=3342077 RepID=UPI00385C9EC8
MTIHEDLSPPEGETTVAVVACDETAVELLMPTGHRLNVQLATPRQRYAVIQHQAGTKAIIVAALCDTHDEATVRFYDLLEDRGLVTAAERGPKP